MENVYHTLTAPNATHIHLIGQDTVYKLLNKRHYFTNSDKLEDKCLGLGLHDTMMAVASEQVGLGGEQTNKAALTPLPSRLISMAHCGQRALVTHMLQTSNHMEYSSKCILTSKSSPGNGNSSNIIYYYGHSMTTTLNVTVVTAYFPMPLNNYASHYYGHYYGHYYRHYYHHHCRPSLLHIK